MASWLDWVAESSAASWEIDGKAQLIRLFLGAFTHCTKKGLAWVDRAEGDCLGGGAAGCGVIAGGIVAAGVAVAGSETWCKQSC